MNRIFRALAAALFLLPSMAAAQSVNPFNPDFAWCATQGSVATRGATTWNCLTPGTAGQVLRTNGAGANVSWQTVSGTGTVTSVGLTMPSIFSVSGSPITTTGTLAASLASQAANTFFAAPNGSAGTPSFRLVTLADIPQMDAAHLPNAGVSTGSIVTGTFPALDIATQSIPGNRLVNGTITSTQIQGASVSRTRLANMADGMIMSNISGATASPADNSLTSILDYSIGSAQGTIAYRGASGWNALTPGLSGQLLQSGGAGGNPSWTTPVITPTQLTGVLNTSGRLTVTSGSPLENNATSGTIYFTPYVGNIIPLYDGTNMIPTAFNELSQLATDTTKSPAAAAASSVYDMFVWNDGGTLRLSRGPVWTNATTRAMALSMVQGIQTNATAITNGPAANRGTYVGTVLTNSSAQFQVTRGGILTAARIGVWNAYNRIALSGQITTAGGATSWTPGTTATNVAGNSAFNVAYVTGDIQSNMFQGATYATTTASGYYISSFALDGATAGLSGVVGSSSNGSATPLQQQSTLGAHNMSLYERCTAAAACTGFGDNERTGFVFTILY